MALLLSDQRTVFGSEAPRSYLKVREFDMRDPRLVSLLRAERVNLSEFEKLKSSPVTGMSEIVVTARRASPRFVLDSRDGQWDQGLTGGTSALGWGGRYAVRDAISGRFVYRPPRALDATLVFRLDGNPDSPTMSVGGGVAAAVWQVVQQP